MKKGFEIATPETLGTSPSYVLQPNGISRACFNLSATAIKLFAMSMSLLPKDTNVRSVSFSIYTFCNSLGLLIGGNSYELIDKATNECVRCLIKLENNNEWLKFTLFSAAYLDKKTNTITMTFSEEISSCLTELRKMYAKIELVDLGKLSSKYAARLYELVFSYASLAGKDGNAMYSWYCTRTVAELREILAIEPDLYPRTNDFRTRVIEGPLNEINKANIGIEIKPEYIRQGKSLHSIRFNCKKVDRQYDLPGLLADTPETLQEKELAALRIRYPEEYKQFFDEEMEKPVKFPMGDSIREGIASHNACLRLKEKHGIRR